MVNMTTTQPYSIRNVLAAVDFSPLGFNALQTAIAISKQHQASLTVIHVIENSYVLSSPETGDVTGNVLQQVIHNADKNLGELAEYLRNEHGISVDHAVQSGNPADEICRWSLHHHADLIVAGTHGDSGIREFFMGSNAYRIVKNSPCPVMTIPGYQQWLDFKKVLFPIRMVPHALDKYDMVRPIIQKTGASMMIAGIVKDGDKAAVGKMNSIVDNVRVRINEDHVACTSNVYPCEHVSTQVLKIAEQDKPDLIVITATLDTSVKDFFLGPYTQDIVNHAHVPVLSIRPQEAGEGTAAFKGYLEEITRDLMATV